MERPEFGVVEGVEAALEPGVDLEVKACLGSGIVEARLGFGIVEAAPVPRADLELKVGLESEAVEEVKAAPESGANLELKVGLESEVVGFWAGRESEANLEVKVGLESEVV